MIIYVRTEERRPTTIFNSLLLVFVSVLYCYIWSILNLKSTPKLTPKNNSKLHSKKDSRLHSMFYNMPNMCLEHKVEYYISV